MEKEVCSQCGKAKTQARWLDFTITDFLRLQRNWQEVKLVETICPKCRARIEPRSFCLLTHRFQTCNTRSVARGWLWLRVTSD